MLGLNPSFLGVNICHCTIGVESILCEGPHGPLLLRSRVEALFPGEGELFLPLGNDDALFKYADDSTIIAPVWKEVDYSDNLVSQFLDWTNTNGMSCNPSKCKELTIKKRGNRDFYSPIGMIPSCKEVEILGVTFQCDSKFSVHVKNKLIKANKSLHILRTLRKERYNQSEIDLLFNTIVLPNI